MGKWTIDISGESFVNSDGSHRQDEISKCDIGEAITLRHDPMNKFDSSAVAVYSVRGVQMGFIPKSHKAIRRRVIAGNAVSATVAEKTGGSDGYSFGLRITVEDTDSAVPSASSLSKVDPSAGNGCAFAGVLLVVGSLVGAVGGFFLIT